MIVCWFQNMIRLHLFLLNLYVFIRVFHHSRVLFIVGGVSLSDASCLCLDMGKRSLL
jgi:hypothetical protein